MILSTLTYIGILTAIEACVDFNCRTISRPLNPCTVTTSFNDDARFGGYIGEASVFGQSFPQQWFQMGAESGTHGQSGMRTLTLFYRGNFRALRVAYYSEYSDSRTYKRFKCERFR